jgi:PBP1b-binding outer membrane lipoprotein LpoB
MKRGIIAIVLALLLLVGCAAPMEKQTEIEKPAAQETLPPSPQYEPPPTAPDVVESETAQ